MKARKNQKNIIKILITIIIIQDGMINISQNILVQEKVFIILLIHIIPIIITITIMNIMIIIFPKIKSKEQLLN